MEETDKEKSKIKKRIIYEDCFGNIDTNFYLYKDEAEAFKEFLEKLGYEKIEIIKHEKSEELQRAFRQKPTIIRRIEHDIDWTNPEVYKIALKNVGVGSNEVVKEMVKASGEILQKVNKQVSLLMLILGIFLMLILNTRMKVIL